MKIGLISTFDGNIGNDLLREGVIRLLSEHFEDQPLEFVYVDRLNPYSVYPPGHPVRIAQSVSNVPGLSRLVHHVERVTYSWGLSRLDDCELVVLCGIPYVKSGCASGESITPLWDHVIARLSACGTSVWHLAAGSRYPMERLPERVDLEDAAFLSRAVKMCRVTTVQDAVAQQVLGALGFELPLLASPALLAGRGRPLTDSQGDFVAVNYLQGAGPDRPVETVDPNAWERTFLGLIDHVGRSSVLWVCHSDKETEWAARLAPEVRRYRPRGVEDFFQTLRGAKAGVVNRMQTAVAMAGMGIPSIAVGTDTPLQTVSAIGLPAIYAKDASLETLKRELSRLIGQRDAERRRLLHLREQTWSGYLSHLDADARLRRAA
jgi:hypothetical protein